MAVDGAPALDEQHRTSLTTRILTMKIVASLLLASAASTAAFTGSSSSVRSSVAVQESQVRVLVLMSNLGL